jgi:thiamine pyrophosphokinase
VVVFGGGSPPSPRAIERLPAGALVVAADSGYDHARAHGIDVDELVGDLDSISPDALEAAKAAGVPIDLYPAAKDATDLALALLTARDAGAVHITVVAGDGGRLDHLLTGLLALADPALADAVVEAWIGDAWVRALHGPGRAEIHGRPGELVTLAAVGGSAIGVRTEALVYPLHDETLEPGSTRGVSNVLETTEATVSLEEGTLLIVQPEALA